MYELHCQDALEYIRALEPGDIDCLVTDPPYKTGNSHVIIRGNGVTAPIEDSKSVGDEWGYSLDWVDEAARLQPKQWIVFCGYMMLGDLMTAIAKHATISMLFTWRKNNAPRMTRNVPRLDCEFVLWARAKGADCRRAREFQSMVLDVNMPQAGCFATERILEPGTSKAAHPTQKPIAIVLPFIERLTNPGETILDPFTGTGTTGAACIRLGRKFKGVDSNPTYHAIALRRLQDAAAQPSLFASA